MGCTESKAKPQQTNHSGGSHGAPRNPVAPLPRRVGPVRASIYDDDDSQRVVYSRDPSRHARTNSNAGSEHHDDFAPAAVAQNRNDPAVGSPLFGDSGLKHVVLQPSEVLGRGGYGVVYKAYVKSTKVPLAVKECRFDESNLGMVNALKAEFEVLSKLNHPHVVKVFHFAVENNCVARVFMELMPQGSVRSVVSRLNDGAEGGKLTETSARRIIHQALLGLRYLHQRRLLHRDLKPDNMLVDANGVVKLSDFGTTKEIIHAASGTTTMVVGTVMYMAPENIAGKYSAASDIWAVAASFLELVTGKPPWHETGIKTNVALLFHIGTNPRRSSNHHPLIPKFLSPDGRRVLRRCFEMDPKKRPSADELLNDPYFHFDDFAGHDDDHDDAASVPLSMRTRTPSEFLDADGGYLRDEELDEESSLGSGSFASVDS